MCMLSNSYTQGDSNESQFWKQKLAQQNILLCDKYGIPSITNGSPKQIPWATDLRAKFLIDFDSVQSTLDESIKQEILQWLSHTDARHWIDNKKITFKMFLAMHGSQARLTENTLPIHSTIEIDTRDSSKVTVHTTDKELDGILSGFGFTAYAENVWIRQIAQNDVERTGLVETLSMQILQMGKAMKILSNPAPLPYHDAQIMVHDGKLCVICNTEATYRAFSHLGSRLIYLDGADKEKLKSTISMYDVGITKDAEDFL